MHRLSLLLVPLALLALAPRPAAANDKELRAVVEKAIKAHGGADKLNKYLAQTVTMKGKINVMEMTIDFVGEAATLLPDRMKVHIEFEVAGQAIKFTQVLNKDKGWLKINDMVMELNKDQMADAREELHVNTVTAQLTPLLKKEYTLSSLGEVKVDGKPAIGIQASRKGYRDINLYFDSKTLLLVKTEHRSKDEQGKEVTQTTYYSEFKEFSGLKVATKFKIKRDDKDFMEATASDVKLEEKLSDDTFAKP